jgi:RNA polymerase sigma factor (sigma-70 family)
MESEGSITHWIGELKAGNPQAFQELYRSYLPRLIGLARKKMPPAPHRLADEEDVVQSVFGSFCQLAERGLYPSLQHRDDLWGLLLRMTARKIGRIKRNEQLQKHGGDVVIQRLPEAPSDTDEIVGLSQLLDHEPTPEEAAQFAEEVEQRLACLEDDQLVQVARLKMENFTNEEIASRLGSVTRTVERKLRLIRDLWKQMDS